MNHRFRIPLLSSVLSILLATGCGHSPKSTASRVDVDSIIHQLTLQEKVTLLVGDNDEGNTGDIVGFTRKMVTGAAGSTAAVTRLGITPILMADGPAGVRISPLREGDPKEYYCTSFPIASAIACTWNLGLAQQVGEAIGYELKEYGCDLLLAPALNIHRHPLCGRNFEYYSEDPLLSGLMAAHYVRGVQSNGVGATIKHYAANNQESNRKYVNVKVDERSLREIYLRGFEIAVHTGQPWAVMSSYNKVNGQWVAEDSRLLDSVLRGEWGFDGLVMTDWNTKSSISGQLKTLNSLSMPGHAVESNIIRDAVESGMLNEKILDANLKKVLELMVQTPRFNNYAPSQTPDTVYTQQVARNAAAEAAVLLRNTDRALPLAKGSKVLLVGKSGYEYIKGGSGSGDVHSKHIPGIAICLRSEGFDLGQSSPNIRATEISGLADSYDAGLLVIGRHAGEFADRSREDLSLTGEEQSFIDEMSDAFSRTGKPFIVVLNIPGVIYTAGWKAKADAIVLGWQLGQTGAETIAGVLSGRINPSGKLAMTFPNDLSEMASDKNFPGIPEEEPAEVRYDEGIMVGYRDYLTRGIRPSYEFGFGLSYTDFSYSDLKVTFDGRNLKIAVSVKNIGPVPGKEVVQIYVKAPGLDMPKPESELRAFGKTEELASGQSQRLRFSIPVGDLASYDATLRKWTVEEGEYEIRASSSCLDNRLRRIVLIQNFTE